MTAATRPSETGLVMAVLLVVVGAAVAVYGVSMLSIPAAVVVGGCMLIAVGLLVDFDRLFGSGVTRRRERRAEILGRRR